MVQAPGNLDVTQPGWLSPLLELYLELREPLESEAAVRAVKAEHPGAPEEELARILARRRLEPVGLHAELVLLPRRLRAHLQAQGFSADDLLALGLLTVRWDVFMDVAQLYRNYSSARERQIELLTVEALARSEAALAKKLKQAHLDSMVEVVDPRPWAQKVEKLLAPGGRLVLHEVSLSIGVGIAILEARHLAATASLYFSQSTVEEEGLLELYQLNLGQKVQLIEVLIAIAGADGHVDGSEKALIEELLRYTRLPGAEVKRLRKLLKRAPELKLEFKPMPPANRRFVLEQAILLSVVDDEQDERELELLQRVTIALGGDERELEEALVRVLGFYAAHRDAVLDFGPVALGRMQGLIARRLQKVVKQNLTALVTEIKETGELAMLLGARSVRPLTPEENQKVKQQLMDVCRSIPALAIFALPGGGLLLPILIKLLPFNLLPSAFDSEKKPAKSAKPAPDA
ncbi:MAG: TerB family tellurite resistance protein [Planctomycetota bacterium]